MNRPAERPVQTEPACSTGMVPSLVVPVGMAFLQRLVKLTLGLLVPDWWIRQIKALRHTIHYAIIYGLLSA
ncbi:unnamed protein product [Protopolystoma xenopodis]|uniref:Uncharacterized protein n=1 Tax=Protopolystoma xenopodis TaxID=117903 RepID=A0A3S5B1Y4_9PLAT|nr:unnamed protein product [Protopolystoma xenopodis]